MMMKRVLAGVILILGAASGIRAQGLANANGDYGVTPVFQAVPVRDAGDLSGALWAPKVTTVVTDLVPDASAPNVTALAVPAPVPSAGLAGGPEPAPAPDPKFLYGGRDDYRWQLGLGASWERFRSTIFNASAVGFNTSIAYYLNNWLGVEGNALEAFAPQIFLNEHVKLLNFTGGPRIAWRQRRWEPWLHGLVGLSHEQPQTTGHSRNAFAAQLGGGADYRINPRLSLRLQGDWLHTLFFSQSQNNFVLVGGAVIHF
jgi:opacity protein-like surface antigen